MEKNSCYIDWKFRRIKGVNPGAKCVALVQVAQAGAEQVREYVRPVMAHADVVCYSMEELGKVVSRLGVKGTGKVDD